MIPEAPRQGTARNKFMKLTELFNFLKKPLIRFKIFFAMMVKNIYGCLP
jgi:hypothetical protein